MDYGFTHEGMTVTPNGTAVPAEENGKRNQEIERAELKQWQAGPDRVVAYYHFGEGITGQDLTVTHSRQYFGKDCTVTTWPGTVIGRIVSAKVYRHNFGGRFVAIRVIGTNGVEYCGRASYDWGNVIRLRRVAK
jgi:hypothetical protein